jgi:hypothetical protein
MKKPDGGPAFPGDYWDGTRKTHKTGMSLRDCFAGQAMQVFLADLDIDITDEQAAKQAYKSADAMLAQRGKEDDDESSE